jgi:peptidoglycan/LPS O-acetylase OafA/YrhL
MSTHRSTAYLDGVRGWASLAVVIHHAREGFLRAGDSPWQHRLLSALGDGEMAVHVFFVLSGFVLSVRFLQTADRRVLEGLALRRYPRLTIPIVVVALLAYLMLRIGFVYNHAAAELLRSTNNLGAIFQFPASLMSALKFSVYDVYLNYRFETSYNTNLWTMPIELLGSFLVFGLLFIPLPKWGRRGLILAALLLALFTRSIYADFMLGVVIAELAVDDVANRLPKTLTAALSIGCVLGAIGLRVLFPGRAWMFAAAAGLIVAFPVLSVMARRFFGNPISRWLGKVSFPLYLIHPLVIVGPASWLALRLAGHGAPPLLARDAVILATVVLSLLAARALWPVEALAIAAARRFSEAVFLLFRRKRQPA